MTRSDESAAILQSYDDPLIRILTNPQNIGLTCSLNKGLRLARGEYVARIDTDDISMPARLKLQTCCLDEHPEVGMVATRYEVTNERGKVLRTDVRSMSHERLCYSLTFSNSISHSSVMFRKQLVLDLGGHDAAFDLAEDLELWHRISRRCKIGFVSGIFTKWRLSDKSLSARFQAAQCAAGVAFLTKSISAMTGNDAAIEDIKCFQDLYYSHAQRLTSLSASL
jgi:glycosyltransferase involved in cell wall biosynthesis